VLISLHVAASPLESASPFLGRHGLCDGNDDARLRRLDTFVERGWMASDRGLKLETVP